MWKFLPLAAFLLLASLSGCAKETTNWAGSLRVKYEDLACYRDMGGNVITVDDNALANRVCEGHNCIDEHYVLSDRELKELYAFLQSSGFFNLESKYVEKGVMDGSCATMTVSMGENSKAVELINKEPEPVRKIAVKLRDLLCSKGNHEECYRLALKEEVERKTADAIRHFTTACKGKGEACYRLANLISDNGGKAGAELYRTACEKDNRMCYSAGQEIERRGLFDAKVALNEVRAFYISGCEYKDRLSCQRLAEIDSELGNFSQAENAVKRLCEQGEAASCYELAEIKEKQEEAEEAERFYRTACETGDGYECNRRGIKSENKKEFAEAEAWYRLGCNEKRKESSSCYSLGKIEKQNGRLKEAKRLFSMVCDRGGSWGCESLGDTEAEEGNLSGAKQFYTQAAATSCCGVQVKMTKILFKQGDTAEGEKMLADACARIPSACYAGAKREQEQGDQAAAARLFRSSCSHGYAPACVEAQ